MTTIQDIKTNLQSVDEALRTTSDISYAFSLLVQAKDELQKQLRAIEAAYQSTSCSEDSCLAALEANNWDLHDAILQLYQDNDFARPATPN